MDGAESLQVSGDRPFRSAQMPSLLNSNVETDEVLRRNATNNVTIRQQGHKFFSSFLVERVCA